MAVWLPGSSASARASSARSSTRARTSAGWREDALVATYTYQAEYEARQRQVESAINAANLSWVRYEGGMTSYLEVLDLQRSQFNAELSASEALDLQLASVVQLYKALGGGWPVPPEVEADAD